jgi:predicted enzyme related to lactoylglutathione lyase
MADAGLSLVVIRSADLDRAARFYAAVGLHLARERHGTGSEHLAAELRGTVFEVYPLGDTSGTAAVRLGFRVPSVVAVLAAVESAGGSVVAPARESPWGVRAVVADPDGHRVELIEEARPG